MVVKTVLGESPYLACSSLVTAGETASADLVPAILSIIFEECRRCRLIPDYPLIDTPLIPDESTQVDSNLNSDVEELTEED